LQIFGELDADGLTGPQGHAFAGPLVLGVISNVPFGETADEVIAGAHVIEEEMVLELRWVARSLF